METRGDQRILSRMLAVNALLRCEIAAVKVHLIWRREAKHNPNWRLQPRAPKGTSEGGQWVGRGPKGRGTGKPIRSTTSPPPPPPSPGHNRPPADSLQEIFPYWANASASAILAPIDDFVGLSWARNSAADEAFANQRDWLVAQITQIDPTFRFESLDPGGTPSSQAGRTNMINTLRAQRAAALYNIRGEVGPLQVETLRFIQGSVDRAYSQAETLFKLRQLEPRLSRNEAIGNHVDLQVRRELRSFYNALDVATGSRLNVRVIGREYSSNGNDRTFRVPDAKVGNVLFDWTLARKQPSDPQIRGFFQSDLQPIATIIIRPSQLEAGGTYAIMRPDLAARSN